MTQPVSGGTSQILAQIQGSRQRDLLAGDLKGSLDINKDNRISANELKLAAQKAKIDVSQTPLADLTTDAQNLTQFMQKGGALTHVNLESLMPAYEVETLADPKPPALEAVKSGQAVFQRGQQGPEVAQIVRLLNNLGYQGQGQVFTQGMEAFVKRFQEDNGLIDPKTGVALEACSGVKAGILDAQTLRKMEIATKFEDPYQSPEEAAAERNLNEYERVRQSVLDQLNAKGVNGEQALQLGEELTEAAVQRDRAMSSSSMCYTAVKQAIENAVDLPYQTFGGKKGSWARTAGQNLFDKHPELFQKIQIDRKDVHHLPPGAVVVYKPQDQSEYGHIGVQSMQLKTPQQKKAGQQGLPVVNVYSQNGQIEGLDVKDLKGQIITYKVDDGLVLDATGKETGLSIEHTDISDKQRDNPWSTAPVDVYFPIATVEDEPAPKPATAKPAGK